MRISFIDQPEVIKKIFPVCVRTRTGRQHLGLWEEPHAPPDRSQEEEEITFDSSYSQLIEPQLEADIQLYFQARLKAHHLLLTQVQNYNNGLHCRTVVLQCKTPLGPARRFAIKALSMPMGLPSA